MFKITLIALQSLRRLTLSVYWSSWLTTFSSCSTDKYSNRRLTFQWILTVHDYLLICFCILMRRNLSKDFWSLARKKLAQSFNFTYRFIDDVHSLNNSKFSDYLEFIYPSELDIKDTTESMKATSYLDCLLEIDNSGKLSTKLYDKRDDFNFPIVNFSFLCGNIPASPAYGVFASQLIRYARAWSLYHDLILRARQLATNLLTQSNLNPRLVSTIKKFYGWHCQLVASYTVSVTQFICDIFKTC